MNAVIKVIVQIVGDYFMIYSIQNWKKEEDNILYFFHRLEEMLFHYSSDIVRMPIHNTRTLIKEYLYNESERNAGRVNEYQLEQIINELKSSLYSDNVLREKFGNDFVDGIAAELSSQKGDVIKYINNKLSGKTYLNWCIAYLMKHSAIHSHKEEVEKGLRNWIVEIVSRGYTPEYIYNYLKALLSKRHNNASAVLKDFLEHFSIEEEGFRVYLTFTSNMKQCKEVLEKRIHVCFDDDGNFSHIRTRKKDFVGYIEVQALDEYDAIHEAYSMISIFLKYYRVISNRKRELIRKIGGVKHIGSSELSFIPLKSLGYRSIEIEPKADITHSVDSIILNCQTKPEQTRYQIDKMIELHNESLEQPDLNDGFLNLWSILEVISENSIGTSKIEKVIHCVIPTLKKDYMHAVLDNIDQDLKDNLESSEYSALIEAISIKYKNLNPIACFIFLPELEHLREEYFAKLENYPNIRTKIYRLYLLKDNKSEINAISEKYAQRIKWHIYRLYRARNAIVHSGEVPQNIQRLGEHLHIYVDRILFEILIKLSNESSLESVSDVLIDTRLLLNKVNVVLSEKSPICEDDIPWMYESFNYESSKQE